MSEARRPFLSRLRPASLAARLVLMLVVALALAQVLLVLLLRSQQDNVIEGIIRGQALSRAVTLARLLDAHPTADGERLADAFATRDSCARVTTEPPPAHEMTAVEQGLADLLARRLHGVEAGPPEVEIAPIGPRAHPCGEAAAIPRWRSAGGPPREVRERDGRERESREREGRERDAFTFSGVFSGFGQPRIAAVAITVPLSGGRTMVVRSAVGVPHAWNRVTFLSFLMSSLAAALVAVVVVRSQTRSLRALADASERFGRGEKVAPLDASGPSEVAAAIRAFNTMQDRLSLFIRDRLRLLAGISHDLRTPLTTLRLKAEFIDDEAVRDDIIATIDELTAICEATLAFTRAEAATEETQHLDLRAMCTEVAEEFGLSGADVTAAAGAPVSVACRPVALKRAVRNLVENAVRYGERARLGVERHGDGAVSITVDDEGPGLPADRMEDAFKPFVRLEDSRSTETGGLGLGLAIARSIVAAHGGELTLANREEGGLRAEIRLPPQQAT